ncbi:hypothetical protein ACFQ2B_21755 [Streptomyces stramineus]
MGAAEVLPHGDGGVDGRFSVVTEGGPPPSGLQLGALSAPQGETNAGRSGGASSNQSILPRVEPRLSGSKA